MNGVQRFHDRREAGQLLARRLAPYQGRIDLVVLALPRGGVHVGREIARELTAPLDALLVRKLGVPWHPELAMGAIAGTGTKVVNGDVVSAYNIPPHVIRTVAERERDEVETRLQDYRGYDTIQKALTPLADTDDARRPSMAFGFGRTQWEGSG